MMPSAATQAVPAHWHAPSQVPSISIIGLTGPIGAGKDTAGDYLVHRYGFVTASFAAPIKSMLEALFVHANIDPMWSSKRALKEQQIAGYPFSYRRALQLLGTEWGRRLDSDLWVKALAACIGWPEAPVHDRICITDVRFQNEAQFVSDADGVLVGVHRPTAVPIFKLTQRHASEQDIAALVCNFTLDNRGSIATLHEQIDSLCLQLGIEPRD